MSGPAQGWLPHQLSFTTPSSSSTTFVVPAYDVWYVQSIRVSYTSTSTAGNRQLTIERLNDAGTVLGSIKAGVTQAESLTYTYEFSPGLNDLTSLRYTTNLTTPLPNWYLSPGWSLKIYDIAAIAASADSMTIYATVLKANLC